MFGTAFVTKPETHFGKWRYLFWLGFFLIFFNFFFGHAIDSSLINSFGVKGSAKITDRYGTSTQYNDQNVTVTIHWSGLLKEMSLKLVFSQIILMFTPIIIG